MDAALVEKIDNLQQRLWLGKDDGISEQRTCIPWNWTIFETLELLVKYSTGISEAILLSHLQCKWDKYKMKPPNSDPLFFGVTNLRTLLTGNSLQVPFTAVLFLSVHEVACIPSTTIKITKLIDRKHENEIEWYIPSRLHKLTDNFLSKRTLRLTGCKLVNSCLYGNRLLPTDYVVVELLEEEDSAFIGQQNITALSDIDPIQCDSPIWIFVKVLKISRTRKPSSGSAHVTQEIILEDQHKNRLPLILYDEQYHLSYLFKKMDVLLIENPLSPALDEWKECSHIRYGHNTILYTIKQCGKTGEGQQQQSILLSRFNFRADLPKERVSNRRILLSEVQPETQNISFLVICKEIGANMPSSVGLSRRLVICGDESQETYYITAWGDVVCKQIAQAQPGHILYFYKVRTSDRKEKRFFTNCWDKNGSKVYNVTLTPGLLHTPYFRKVWPLAEAKGKNCFVAEVCILDWILPNSTLPPVSNSYHSLCHRQIVSVNEEEAANPNDPLGSPLKCSFCEQRVPVSQIVSVFTLQWVLGDGNEFELVADALPQVHQSIIQISPFEFQSLSPEERKSVLEQLRYSSLTVWISEYFLRSRRMFRIDQVIPGEPASERN